jgi:hypothetical protein
MKRTRHFDEKMKWWGFSSPQSNDEKLLLVENGVTHLMDQGERDVVVEESKKAFLKVLTLLNEVDPMRLSWVSENEYYVEAVDIVVNLVKCNTREDAKRVFIETFKWWFGEDWSDRFETRNVPSEQLLKIKLDSFQVN